MNEAIILALLLPICAYAGPLGASIWTKGPVDVYVTSLWWSQFKGEDAQQDRQLAVAVTVAMYQGWTQEQKNLVKTGVDRLTSGEVVANRANVTAWIGTLSDSGINVELVSPSDAPSFAAKLYVIVVGKDQNAYSRLISFGLAERGLTE